MRISIVGAGVAGLTAALALQQDGHEIRVLEQARELRATGFGLNLWSNATTLLTELGVDVPGEPFDRVMFRAGGAQRAVMPVPTTGTPHMNGDRGAVISALADRLATGTIRFGHSVTSADELRDEGADLVVVADGVASRLRPDVNRPVRRTKPWVIWQAVLDTGGDLLEPGSGATVSGPTRFLGIWRHPDGGLCWFLEEPKLPVEATAEHVLDRLRRDEDPLVVKVAELTPAATLGQWQARDRWPREIIGDRLAVIGDAAHPMLPCIGQGACLSVEDAVVLAVSLRASEITAGLAAYRANRLWRMRRRVALARAACATRRPSPAATAIASTPIGVPFAALSGAWLRSIGRPIRI